MFQPGFVHTLSQRYEDDVAGMSPLQDQRESLVGEGVSILACDVGGTGIKGALVERACAGHGYPAHLASTAAIVSSSTQTTRVEAGGRVQEETRIDHRLRPLRASISESTGFDKPRGPA